MEALPFQNSSAFSEHVPIYVLTYFIRLPAAEYATQKPDGNLTRPSPLCESLACETILDLLILQFGGPLHSLIAAQGALIDSILILVINPSIQDL